MAKRRTLISGWGKKNTYVAQQAEKLHRAGNHEAAAEIYKANTAGLAAHREALRKQLNERRGGTRRIDLRFCPR